MKIVGWNIFLEKENDDGSFELVSWDISNWLARVIDEEYQDTFLQEEE